jgi:hypothetical protein
MDDRLRAFEPDEYTGDLQRQSGNPPVDGATWYAAGSQGEALVYDVSPGALADAAYLATDFLLDGPDTAMFRLALSDGDATFSLLYGVVPNCEGRVRLPLDALDQHRSALDREGAWCKPMIRGDRVDPADVERVELALVSDPGDGVRWCQSPLAVTADEPPRLTDPALPEGPLLDEFGQATFREWEGRTGGEAELVERLCEQRDAAGDGALTGTFDDWGGRTDREFTATGFFRTHYSGGRWWLVTPDGHPFWSAGLDVVSPNVATRYDGIADALAWLPDEDAFADAFEHWDESGEYVDYLVTNLIRAFGPDEWREAWAETALGRLRELGFNTVGNWSDWEAASEAGIPYTRPLEVEFPETPAVFRDFPDVYHGAFPGDAAGVAAQLESTVGDPAMIGYFLGNEPDWRAGSEPVAVAMLHATGSCATRRELADWLADRYGLGGAADGTGDADAAGGADDGSGADSLAETWNMDVTLDDVREGAWDRALSESARTDLELFSSRMVDRLYGVLGEACREVDPDHLNLGNRLVDVPADWVLEGMAGNVDVLTCNCYRNRLPAEYATVSETVGAPILVGEFHFGAPDAGLPFPSLQPVATQAARGAAYRYYVEHAAAQPWCVGTHYFTMYDESALGRFDGENMNIGFFDVCHRPYEPLADAAREAHERLYALADGELDPYPEAPAYLTSR